jgi:hypothetical protein
MNNQCKWCLKPVYNSNERVIFGERIIFCDTNCEKQYNHNGGHSLYFKQPKRVVYIRGGQLNER